MTLRLNGKIAIAELCEQQQKQTVYIPVWTFVILISSFSLELTRWLARSLIFITIWKGKRVTF